MDIDKAKELLGLNNSFTEKELKQAYRHLARKHHPDAGGMEELFKIIVKAYETLQDFCLTLNNTVPSQENTVEEIRLTDLGRGLGPTINGLPCHNCEGLGYTTSYGHKYIICDHCDDNGLIFPEFSCRPCNGTGKFEQIRSKKIVDCRVCKGSGIFVNYRKWKVICHYCYGGKTLWTDDEVSPIYHKCSICNGTGEIEMMNPVLPKGALI